MPNTDIKETKAIAEKIRLNLSKEDHLTVGNITASIGCAQRKKFEPYSSL